jgi:hypothetical protein
LRYFQDQIFLIFSPCVLYYDTCSVLVFMYSFQTALSVVHASMLALIPVISAWPCASWTVAVCLAASTTHNCADPSESIQRLHGDCSRIDWKICHHALVNIHACVCAVLTINRLLECDVCSLLWRRQSKHTCVNKNQGSCLTSGMSQTMC